MGRPKRSVQAAAELALTPPDELTPTQSLARVVKAEGNNLYTCELPNKKTVVLELDPKFRNIIWLKRGGYVLIDVGSADERKAGSRVVGEIINVVRDEKLWRKQKYWPDQFHKQDRSSEQESGDEDVSVVGKMPPSESEEDEEDG